MYRWDLEDDEGVWIPLEKVGGRYKNFEEALIEAAARNIASGIMSEMGILKAQLTDEQYEAFEKIHITHPECTCKFKGTH